MNLREVLQCLEKAPTRLEPDFSLLKGYYTKPTIDYDHCGPGGQVSQFERQCETSRRLFVDSFIPSLHRHEHEVERGEADVGDLLEGHAHEGGGEGLGEDDLVGGAEVLLLPPRHLLAQLEVAGGDHVAGQREEARRQAGLGQHPVPAATNRAGNETSRSLEFLNYGEGSSDKCVWLVAGCNNMCVFVTRIIT